MSAGAGGRDAGPNRPREWNAGAYHRVSGPQHAWGTRVLTRLELHGDERVLDAGCGTGRVTLALRERLHAARAAASARPAPPGPRGLVAAEAGAARRVCALDRSLEMTRAARRNLPGDVDVVTADLLAMPFGPRFDVLFSTATFHWVLDPAALFRGIAGVLVPGGRLHAQCGGAGNLARFTCRVRALGAAPRYAARFADWSDPWLFLSPEVATNLLSAAGFSRVRAWLEPEPTSFADRAAYRAFIEHVVLVEWMRRFADAPAEGEAFLDALCAAASTDREPWQLDYVRLNLEAELPRDGR